jgi:hypothetical protein
MLLNNKNLAAATFPEHKSTGLRLCSMVSHYSAAQIVPWTPLAQLKLFATAHSLHVACTFHRKQHEAVIQCNLTPRVRFSCVIWMDRGIRIPNIRLMENCAYKTYEILSSFLLWPKLSDQYIHTLNYICGLESINKNPKSKSHYSWRSVNQSVLVSSLFWGSWPDSTLSQVWLLRSFVSWDAPSDEGASLSFVWSLSLSFVQLYTYGTTINYNTLSAIHNICNIYMASVSPGNTNPLSVGGLNETRSRLCC